MKRYRIIYDVMEYDDVQCDYCICRNIQRYDNTVGADNIDEAIEKVSHDLLMNCYGVRIVYAREDLPDIV